MPVVASEVWQAERERYGERVRPWVEARLERRSRRERHPVYDFLFEYYEFRPAHLLRWTPGFGVELAGATRADVVWSDFHESDTGLSLPATSFPDRRLSYLRWATEYLTAVQAREPAFGCAGLHEWAMVYRDPVVRHDRVPLRLTRDETDAVVESQSLRCSHFDAYRFFSPAATPRNRWELTRVTTTEHDQPGCVHVNMDLYRFAYKIAPFTASDIVADAFELALRAREVDMRASPYDLGELGFAPLLIETPQGRTEYAALQRTLYTDGQPIRDRLLEVYHRLLEAKESRTKQASIDSASHFPSKESRTK